MIQFIYGLPGTGKTTLISKEIQADIAEGKPTILIVPEQQTVDTERNMLKILPPSAQLIFEVLNFSRLANKLFRIYGGLSYNYITQGMKNLFMKRTLVENASELTEYKLRAQEDSSLPSLMLAQINEFKTNSISSYELQKAATKLEDGHPLKAKLSDIAEIYCKYEEKVSNSYDDSANDLGKLFDILCRNSFFAGYHVYIDGFSSYTAYEHKIIEKIFSQAEKCVITIPASDDSCAGIHMLSVKNTSDKLFKASDGKAEKIFLKKSFRATTEQAGRILNHLWNFSLNTDNLPSTENENFVTITECDDQYAEAEAVANTILNLTKQGYRHNEIAVIAGNMDAYRGILDSTLDKANIPYFMSENTGLVAEPLVAFIMAAFAIRLKHWRTDDVIAYLKTGLTDIDQSDIDVFELYISAWKISGNRFFDDFWAMNPDGYSENISQRGVNILETANRVKKSFTEPLTIFFTNLNAAKNVAELCDATYEFFKSQNLSSKLEKRAQAAHLAGNTKAALECAGTHKAFIRVLSDISACMGDAKMSVDEFATSLKLVFNNTDIGTIPTAADAVTLGSASMLRASGIKCAILIGMCDGEFPARVSETGFFSDKEKETLASFDINLTSNTVSQSSEELLYAYRAMTLPSEKLMVFYHKTASGASCKPSLAVRRLTTLIPNIGITVYGDLCEEDKIMAKKLAFEQLNSLSKKNRDALLDLFKDDAGYKEILGQLNLPISNTSCVLSKEITEKIFGEKINITPSRLEEYLSCHFGYYCDKILDLKTYETATFNLMNSGNFVHYILEKFMTEIVNEDGSIKKLDDSELRHMVGKHSDDFIEKIFATKHAPQKRLLHHFSRLKRLATLIVSDLYKEACQSKFTPKFFELAIGQRDAAIPEHEIVLKDNSSVLLSGKADRVDIYKDPSTQKVYIRIVDYKTGSKEFSISEVKNGFNTQMLLYLFAICKTKSEAFKQAVGCEDGYELAPASVMYISTNIPEFEVAGEASAEEILQEASNQISRSGIILNDENIIRALNENADPKYLANVTLDNDQFTGKALKSEEDFKLLEKEIEAVISDITEEMKRGSVEAIPLVHAQISPCNYCKMKQICRIDRTPAKSNDTESREEE